MKVIIFQIPDQTSVKDALEDATKNTHGLSDLDFFSGSPLEYDVSQINTDQVGINSEVVRVVEDYFDDLD